MSRHSIPERGFHIVLEPGRVRLRNGGGGRVQGPHLEDRGFPGVQALAPEHGHGKAARPAGLPGRAGELQLIKDEAKSELAPLVKPPTPRDAEAAP